MRPVEITVIFCGVHVLFDPTSIFIMVLIIDIILYLYLLPVYSTFRHHFS